jgi:hypothetical protein
MNIQPNSPDNTNPSLRFDPTRRARELVQPREVESAADADPKAEAAIKEARDEFREKRADRQAALRKNHTANNPELARETAIWEAREELRAKLETRKQNAVEGEGSADRIEISSKSEALARAVESRLAASEEARAARVAELRALYVDGQLNSAERIERAARRMLGDR